MHAAPDGCTLLMAVPRPQSAQRLRKLNFNFIRDITPVAAVVRTPSSWRYIHRFQPRRFPNSSPTRKPIRQTQHGVVWDRNDPPCGRRVIQDDGGRHYGACALSRRGPALTDLIAGQVQVHFTALPAAIEHIRAGRIRALAVTTTTRSEALRDIPSVSEILLGFEASFLGGSWRTTRHVLEIVDKLNKEINAALADPKIKARLADVGGTVLRGSHADFAKLVAEDIEKWAKVIQAANIKPE